MSYVSLLKSVIGLFESRGESANSARFGAATAMTVLVSVNLATVTLFASEMTAFRWLDMFESVPANILGLVALVAWHWWFIGKIQAGGSRPGNGAVVEQANPPNRLWLWYLLASTTFLFMGVVVSIHQ